MRTNTAPAKGKSKDTHLEPFVPPQPTLLVPFEPEVIRLLETQAALMGPEYQPASLVNAIVKYGAEYMTEQDLWWPTMSKKVVRFQSA
jgi:hypothetical protein